MRMRARLGSDGSLAGSRVARLSGGVGGRGGGGVVLALLAEHALLADGALGRRVVVGDDGVGVLLSVVGVDTGGRRGELARRELERGEVELGEHEEVDEAEDGLGEDVKDTVEDHLRVGRDVRRAVGETPGDGVEEPENGQDGSRDGEALLVLLAEDTGGGSSRAHERPPDLRSLAGAEYDTGSLT